MSHIPFLAPSRTRAEHWNFIAAGEKSKQKREEAEREAENVERAGGSYTTAEPHEVQSHQESGLPWGGLSLDHVIATGKTKEQNSRESSMNAAAVSRAGGGSSR